MILRQAILGGLGIAAAATINRRGEAGTARAASAGDGSAAIAAIEQRNGGRLGVFVLDTGSGRTLSHRADERFLLASTFKGPLAAAALARVDAGRDALGSRIRIAPADLLPASPVTQSHLARGFLTVGDACAAILERSDNAAANLLMRRVGGPAAATAFIRRAGDDATRIDRYELVEGWSGDKDTTTPRAITLLNRALLLGDVLRPASRTRLLDWMRGNINGRERLRGGLPAGWQGADRTGTDHGICNDYAIVWPPNRPPLLVSAYHDRPDFSFEQTMEIQQRVLREVGAAVAAWAA
ncbi:class A beta-lactamase [Rhizosaccharibacter radicis]|uniref:beta-lactamase n=1 Tax=Rhizosaccharibacter radicis TaxID=2782605 RepID=A0ABT1W033_9PROT|nr:class A beta-lactamase [Acetobacteraceae bacterium KSS12]